MEMWPKPVPSVLTGFRSSLLLSGNRAWRLQVFRGENKSPRARTHVQMIGSFPRLLSGERFFSNGLGGLQSHFRIEWIEQV